MNKLAIRRQSQPLTEAILAVYIEDLEMFDIADVEAACLAIGRRPREDGETSFPAIGAIVNEVRRIKRERREREESEQRAAEERHMREHPEEYVRFDIGAEVKKLAEKRAMPETRMITDGAA